jgi:hypothetical protein
MKAIREAYEKFLMRKRLRRFYLSLCSLRGKPASAAEFETFLQSWRETYQASPRFFR